jgi:glucokinase
MFLGIEIGGTKLQLGIGPGDGALAGLWRGDVVPSDGADGICRQIQAALPELLAAAKLGRDQLHGVGIGFGGPVDDRRQRVVKSHQIDGWDDFPLADWIEQIVGIPAALGNDADVAGLGEALYGAGMGHSPLFYVTIGSGIGGGLIIDREIYRACGRGAAEIGHVRFPVPGQPIEPWVPLEQISSGWAIQNAMRSETNDPTWTTQRVAQSAKEGNATALRILTTARDTLATALCHVIALICPERIVLGGGVSLIDDELWLAPIRTLVGERVFAPFTKCYTIVPAALGEGAVVTRNGALRSGRDATLSGPDSSRRRRRRSPRRRTT